MRFPPQAQRLYKNAFPCADNGNYIDQANVISGSWDPVAWGGGLLD